MTERRGERSINSRQAIFQEFPFLDQWLSNHTEALVYNQERIPGYEEKIEMFGGSDQLSEIIKSLEEKNKAEYVILSACYRKPLYGYEIVKFGFNGTKGAYLLPIATLYVTMQRLIEEGLLEEAHGLISIKMKGEIGELTRNMRGYVTTEDGLSRRVEVSQANESTSALGRLIPVPKGLVEM